MIKTNASKKSAAQGQRVGQIFLIIGAVLLIYLGKLFFFPSEGDKARAHIASLAKLSSFQNALAPLQIFSRLENLKKEISPLIAIDASEYMENSSAARDYSLQDLQSLAPLYFKHVQDIEVLTRDIKQLGNRRYQLVVMARGNTAEKSFNDAYRVIVGFDGDWKLDLVKILSPP